MRGKGEGVAIVPPDLPGIRSRKLKINGGVLDCDDGSS